MPPRKHPPPRGRKKRDPSKHRSDRGRSNLVHHGTHTHTHVHAYTLPGPCNSRLSSFQVVHTTCVAGMDERRRGDALRRPDIQPRHPCLSASACPLYCPRLCTGWLRRVHSYEAYRRRRRRRPRPMWRTMGRLTGIPRENTRMNASFHRLVQSSLSFRETKMPFIRRE